MEKSIHLDDGAYVGIDDLWRIVITANHHEPDEATDRVYLTPCALDALVKWVKNNELIDN